MLVRAKWNVKDGSGWHAPDEVFQTEADLGDAVEILEPVKAPEKETEKPAEKPKASSRRKKVSE